MGASQHQGVDIGALQWFQIPLGQAEHLSAAGDTALDEVDEPRARHPGDLDVARGGERVLIGAGRDRRLGAEDAVLQAITNALTPRPTKSSPMASACARISGMVSGP